VEVIMKRVVLAVLVGSWLVMCGGLAFADGDEQGGGDAGIGQGQAPGAGNMSFDTYVELLRTDLRAQKKQVVSKAMALTPDQEKLFWPIYNDYEHDLAKLTDESVAIVKDYAKSFQSMTDAVARDLMNRTLKNQARKLDLKKAYGRKLEKALSAKIAARFLQVDGIVTKMIELQIDSKLPLVK
jgi:hypothetical protein